ncbi:hypothetical protein ACIBJF_49890 [Streptomyces sp. NPDC050743]|uniref:hypothetical protein n=1 Tax=Streptomyces sp. NPDC050743 TaxID=3365634 RepID=UPI0037A16663
MLLVLPGVLALGFGTAMQMFSTDPSCDLTVCAGSEIDDQGGSAGVHPLLTSAKTAGGVMNVWLLVMQATRTGPSASGQGLPDHQTAR